MKIKKKYNRSLFIDTSDLKIIKQWNRIGIIEGVTTNPQVLLNEGVNKGNYFKIIRNICNEMKGKSVSVELTSDRNDMDKMIEETVNLRELASNISIKVPFDSEKVSCLELMHYLAVEKNVSVNATVLMNFEQIVLAVKAMERTKAECFVSLFWGRSVEDWGQRSSERYAPESLRMGNSSTVDYDPAEIVRSTLKLIDDKKNINLIVGSVRNATMVGNALAAGANVVTVPADIMSAMMYSKRNLETLEQFDEAWKNIKAKK